MTSLLCIIGSVLTIGDDRAYSHTTRDRVGAEIIPRLVLRRLNLVTPLHGAE